MTTEPTKKTKFGMKIEEYFTLVDQLDGQTIGKNMNRLNNF